MAQAINQKLYPNLSKADDVDAPNGNAKEAVPELTDDDDDRSVIGDTPSMPVVKKSLLVTYLLWLLGGWFGLHHFYLRRDGHAFTTWMTFGLYFGIGWMRELWRIPEYVRDANEDPEYMMQLGRDMRKQSQPPVSWARSCGSIIVADILGYLVIGAIPNDLVPEYPHKAILVALIAPAACAVGVHLIGNIGRHKGGIKYPLLAAYATAPAYVFLGVNSVFYSSLAANWAFGYYERRWRKQYDRRKPVWKRLLVLTLCGLLYASLWTSWFYFNCKIEKEGDEDIRCREAAKNFLNSPFWKDFAVVMNDLYVYVTHHGLSGVWQELIASLDPHGEENALKILMLNKSATQEEITNQYRKMIRVWHPDRHKDPGQREVASEKFMGIQQAYETLSMIKSRRMQQSSKSAPNFDRDKSEL